MWDPDEGCTDPADKEKTPRRHVDVIDLDQQDAFLLWRTPHGDQDGPDGHEDIHVVGGGVYENVTVAVANEAAGVLSDLLQDD